MKKCILYLIILFMGVFSLPSFVVNAGDIDSSENEDSIVASGNAGSSLTWTLNDKGEFVVSGEGRMYDESYKSNYSWTDYLDDIISVEFEEGVTSVGRNAFSGAKNLAKVIYPKTMTTIYGSTNNAPFGDCQSLTTVVFKSGLKYIPGYSCYNMSALKNVIIEEDDSGEQTNTITEIGSYAFGECSSLEKYPIPDTVKTIKERAFINCSGVQNFNLPDSVTVIERYAFEGNTLLTSVKLPSNLSSLGDCAFLNCTSLEEVEYPSTIKNTGSYNYPVFLGCTSLKKIMFGAGIEKIPYYACYKCEALEKVEYESNSDGENTVTEIGSYAFGECKALDDYPVPDTVTRIKERAFINCSGVQSFNLPDSVTVIERYAFEGNTLLTSIKLPSNLTGLGDCTFLNCTSLEEVEFPKTISSTGSNSNPIFLGCNNLKRVIFGAGIEKIPSYVCNKCEGLETVEYQKDENNETSVKEIGSYAFGNCTSLDSYPVPETVGIIRNRAFSNCSNVLEFKLPVSVTLIEGYAFEGNTSIMVAKLPEQLTELGECVFYNCTALEELVYPSTIKKVGSSSQNFKNCANLKKIVFEAGIEKIPDNACRGCSSLETVEICKNENDEDIVKEIGSYAFYDCSSLESFPLPESVEKIGDYAYFRVLLPTALSFPNVISIGKQAFYGCKGISRLDYPKSITTVSEQAFYDCSGIEEVSFEESTLTIPNYACDGMTGLKKVIFKKNDVDMDSDVETEDEYIAIGNYAFRDCKSLESIDIPDSVKTIGRYAFSGCTSLVKMDLTDNVKTIGEYAFSGCSALESLRIPGSVSSISSGLFNSCTAITELSFGYGITSIPNSVCSGMTSLKKVILEDSVDGAPTLIEEVGSYAFSGCKSLEEVETSGGFNSIGAYAFNGCEKLTSVCLLDGIQRIENNTFNNCKSLADIEIPDSVTYIGNNSFENCESFTEIILPESVSEIGYSAFMGCTGVTAVNLDDTVVTTIAGSTFKYCSSIKRIKIPKGVKTIGDEAFSGCSSINSLIIPDSVETFGNLAFQNLKLLKSITIPEALYTVGSNTKGPFYGCESLSEINFSGKVRKIPDNLFSNCSAIKSISLPKTVLTIGNYAFNNCTSLEEVKINGNLLEIGNSSFYGCTSLASFSMPDTVCSIGSYAFKDCTSLSDVTLSKELETISYEMFRNCNLKSIELYNKVKKIDTYAFRDNSMMSKITIPATVTNISYNAFNQDSLTVFGASGSEAEKLANNRNYIFISGTQTESLEPVKKDNISLSIGTKGYLGVTILPSNSVSMITWSSSDEGVATVEVDSTDIKKACVTGINTGTSTITAESDGKSYSWKVTVNNNLSNISITNSKQKNYYINSLDGDYAINYSITPQEPENINLVWSSSKEDIVKVDETGKLTPISNGVARVVVRDTISGLLDYCFVHVSIPEEIEKVTLDKHNIFITGGDVEFTVKCYPSGKLDRKYSWSVNNTTIASITPNGNTAKLMALKSGTVTVTVTDVQTSLTDTCEVKIDTEGTPISDFKINDTDIEIDFKDGSISVEAMIEPADATCTDIIWESSDETVATVDENGVVTPITGGEVVITATTVDGNKKVSCNITINQIAESISLNKNELVLSNDMQFTLKEKVNPVGVTDDTVTWYSTNTYVAEVDQFGNVKANNVGEATIKCVSQDGSYVVAECRVVVKESLTEEEENALNIEEPDWDKDILPHKPSKPTGSPEPTEVPEPTETPEPIEVPEVTETPDPTEVPNVTESPKPTQSPKPAKKPKSNEAAVSPEPVKQIATPAPVEVQPNSSTTITVDNIKVQDITLIYNDDDDSAKVVKTKITKLKKGKKKATVTWKKVTDADGYCIQYSTNKKMKKSKTLKVGNTENTCKINKLKSGTKYFVRVRAFKKIGGVTIYGKWSSVKAVRVK